MEQLSWTDDMMLRAERPETPMQIQMLLIYDQSTAPAGKVTFKRILEETRRTTTPCADLPAAADGATRRTAHAVLGR